MADKNIRVGISCGPLSPEEKYGKVLIMGRAQTGKSSLAKKLSEATGLTVLKTSTSRPRRFPDEDTYHFYTPEKAEAIPPDEKLFSTFAVDGYERWTDRHDFLDAGIAILDATAMVPAVKLWQAQGYRVCILYLEDDESIRRTRWMKTVASDDGSDWDQAIESFQLRESTEALMFDELEDAIHDCATDSCPDIDPERLAGQDMLEVFQSHGVTEQEAFLPGFITRLAAGARPAGGFRSSQCKEDLVLEPEDWAQYEWHVLCRLLGLVPENTSRAVIKAPLIEYFSDPKNRNSYREDPV